MIEIFLISSMKRIAEANSKNRKATIYRTYPFPGTITPQLSGEKYMVSATFAGIIKRRIGDISRMTIAIAIYTCLVS